MKHTKGPWKVSNYRPNRIIARDPKEGTYAVGDDKFETLATVETSPSIIGFGDHTLIAMAPTAPHACEDPACPGDINRRKIEAFDRLHAAAMWVLNGINDISKDGGIPTAEERYASWDALKDALDISPKVCRNCGSDPHTPTCVIADPVGRPRS